jgi:hypothetical protein
MGVIIKVYSARRARLRAKFKEVVTEARIEVRLK